MSGLFDAFWRAAAYCLHPRVMLLSLAPVLLAGGAVLGLGWWFWGDAVDGVQTALSHWTLSMPCCAGSSRWAPTACAPSWRP